MGIYELLDTDMGFSIAMLAVGLFLVGFEYLTSVVLKIVDWFSKGKNK